MKTDNSKKLMVHTLLLSRLTLVIGTLLMIFKIYADSEPGAIPLLMIVVGAGWYFVSRFQLRSQGRVE